MSTYMEQVKYDFLFMPIELFYNFNGPEGESLPFMHKNEENNNCSKFFKLLIQCDVHLEKMRDKRETLICLGNKMSILICY